MEICYEINRDDWGESKEQNTNRGRPGWRCACQEIDDKINEGEIDLPCDGEDYKYNRELFVSEVKENV